MDLEQVQSVALEARADFESGSVDSDELKVLYQEYNPQEDIDLFVQRAEEMFPSLNCGLATAYLRKRVGEGKIINGKYGAHSHTFLLLSESVVVDITSDQYGGPPIYVGPLQSPWSIR